jgi:hypothetical protein
MVVSFWLGGVLGTACAVAIRFPQTPIVTVQIIDATWLDTFQIGLLAGWCFLSPVLSAMYLAGLLMVPRVVARDVRTEVVISFVSGGWAW